MPLETGIPKQVEEAAALAEQTHAEMFPATPPEVPEAGAAAPDTPPVSDTPPPSEEVVDWEQRYKALEQTHKTLQGKYSAEVPRLAEENRELKQLKERVFDQLGKLPPSTPDTAPPPNATVDPILERIREQYGDEYIENNSAIARYVVQQALDEALKTKLQPVQQQVQSIEDTQAAVALENFTGYLDAQVKADWRPLWEGNDPDFMAYLENVEPISGFKLKDILLHHNNQWNADGMVKIFNGYIETKGQPAPPPAAPTPPVPQTPPLRVNPAQEALVAPSRSAPASTPTPSDQRIWTRETINQFQKDDHAGKYDEATSKAMWDDLLSALKEGRIK